MQRQQEQLTQQARAAARCSRTVSRFTPPPRARTRRASSAQGRGDALGALTLDQTCDVGAGDEHEVVVCREARGSSPQNASRSARLTALRSRGAADLAADRDPEPTSPSSGVVGARERVEDQEAVGVRAAVAVDAVEVAAARQPAALAPLRLI